MCSFPGFNPVWEETITFILTFPDLANFRFVVWDEDPIGRDFIGQVTLPFSSLMPGIGDQQNEMYKCTNRLLIMFSTVLTFNKFRQTAYTD